MTAQEIDALIRKLIALRDAIKVAENAALVPDNTQLLTKINAEYAKVSAEITAASPQ